MRDLSGLALVERQADAILKAAFLCLTRVDPVNVFLNQVKGQAAARGLKRQRRKFLVTTTDLR